MTVKKVAATPEVAATDPAKVQTPLEVLGEEVGNAMAKYTAAIPEGEGVKGFEDLIEFLRATLIVIEGFYDTVKKLAAMA